MSERQTPMRLLLVGVYAEAEQIGEYVAGRLLLEALAERSIECRACRPWFTPPDLRDYQVMMTWPYRTWRRATFAIEAARLERRARDARLAIVNPVAGADARRHSHFLTRWGESGLRCARCEPFTTVDEMSLPYPVILRTDGWHRGAGVVRADDPAQARAAVEARERELRQPWPDDEWWMWPRRFDLAVEYLDTRDARGRFHKYRSYVAGDRVIPCHKLRGRDWLVNWDNVELAQEVLDEHKAFLRRGEPGAEILVDAARAAGTEIVGIDYTRDRDGRLTLWEGNTRMHMYGDVGYFHDRRPRRADRAFAQSIADLVLIRATDARRRSETNATDAILAETELAAP